MSVYEGFKHYVCDRCGREAYIKPGTAEEQSWSTVHRVGADKATDSNPVTNYTMCYACRTAYNEFDKPQDAAFNDWMGQPARDAAAKQAADDLKTKQEAEAEKEQRNKEIANAVAAAVAKARAEQKAEDEKTMSPAADGTDTPSASVDKPDTTNTGTPNGGHGSSTTDDSTSDTNNENNNQDVKEHD